MVWQGILNFRTKASEAFFAKPYLISFRDLKIYFKSYFLRTGRLHSLK